MKLGADPRDVMRHMTDAEVHSWYIEHRWPCCGAPSEAHERGPRGGAAVNLACPRCDMRLNVIDPRLDYQAEWGQVIREPKQLKEV